ncbi:MAG: hypothetical protein AB7G93_04090 [Bdellovibrionales bacterium]
MRAMSMAFTFSCILHAFSAPAWARAKPGSPGIYGYHYGYTFEVAEEKNKRDVEMVMLEEPKDDRKPLTEVIFNEKLSREFQRQYEYRFGQTQAEQVINSPGRTDEYTYYSGANVTIQEYQKQQQKFAEYMGRRLTEFHVDNWAKKDPDFRPVYEMKDRVSNLNVQVKKGYKVKWKYNFAGPNMDLSVENPYDIEARMRMEMSGIVSSPTEVIYTVGYPVTKKVRVTALHKQIDGIYQLVGTRQLTKTLSTSLTGSIDTAAAGLSVQQNLILIGLSWSE